jgi:hypothetical protein
MAGPFGFRCAAARGAEAGLFFVGLLAAGFLVAVFLVAIVLSLPVRS